MKNRYVLLWALTAALSGFLFGFDTDVISDAEQAVQRLWSTNEVGTMVPQLVFALTIMVETRGRSLEELSASLLEAPDAGAARAQAQV
jgi:hypothetical protein